VASSASVRGSRPPWVSRRHRHSPRLSVRNICIPINRYISQHHPPCRWRLSSRCRVRPATGATPFTVSFLTRGTPSPRGKWLGAALRRGRQWHRYQRHHHQLYLQRQLGRSGAMDRMMRTLMSRSRPRRGSEPGWARQPIRHRPVQVRVLCCHSRVWPVPKRLPLRGHRSWYLHAPGWFVPGCPVPGWPMASPRPPSQRAPTPNRLDRTIHFRTSLVPSRAIHHRRPQPPLPPWHNQRFHGVRTHEFPLQHRPLFAKARTIQYSIQPPLPKFPANRRNLRRSTRDS
jgi:hypothetical protein